MSKIVPLPRLAPARCQLPVSWYLDPEIFAREQQMLFAAG
jgi:hypothetical protein